MKIVFLGTPEWAVPSFERVIADGHEVLAVFTQPDKPAGRGNKLHPPPVKQAALAHQLTVYQPTKVRTPEFQQLFDSLAPDVAIIVAYGRIIPEWILKIPKYGFINVHFSLLPAYRGAAPINWAIVNGEKQTGITTMQLVPELDAGDILLQQATEISDLETAEELGKRLSFLGAELLSQTLDKLLSITPQKQDHEKATFAPILKREDGKINWQEMTAQEVALRVRGFQPWPGAYTLLKGTRLIIWQAKVKNAVLSGNNQPGTIVQADKNGIVIACNQSTALTILELQLEGRKRLQVRDFLNGIPLQVDESLDG
ncbi:MAG: methionyl-tRNA formyltransferase [Blastocatellia bacterium]|nr:methionyl-tRNA formyltransferase [Blastocatellia bacterium]MBN8722991.1 methionyl-tRNA formyltransferase [Acidobacteriota bacterium]